MSELLVGRGAIAAGGLPRLPQCVLANPLSVALSLPLGLALAFELSVELRQPRVDVGIDGWRSRGGGGADARRADVVRRAPVPVSLLQCADQRVGLLHLFEPPGGLRRAAIVIWVMQLYLAPVGGANLGVGRRMGMPSTLYGSVTAIASES